MKYFGLFIRLIVAGAGLFLAGYAILLAWETLIFLEYDSVTPAIRKVQHARIGAHVIAIFLGLALVIFAIPRRKKGPMPSPPPKLSRWRFYLGSLSMLIFVSSCLQYIRNLGQENTKLEDDVSVKVAAVLFWLVMGIACFKARSSSPKKSKPAQE